MSNNKQPISSSPSGSTNHAPSSSGGGQRQQHRASGNQQQAGKNDQSSLSGQKKNPPSSVAITANKGAKSTTSNNPSAWQGSSANTTTTTASPSQPSSAEPKKSNPTLATNVVNSPNTQQSMDEDAEGYRQMESGVVMDEPSIQLVVNSKSGGIRNYSIRYQDQSNTTTDKIELIPSEEVPQLSTQPSDLLMYSDDGTYLAYLDKIDPFSPNKVSRLFVMDSFSGVNRYILVQQKEIAITKVHFSPRNSYLITLGKWNGEATGQDDNILNYNLRVWKLKPSASTQGGLSLNLSSTPIELNESEHLLMKFSHKPTESGLWPVIQWNEDETLMAYFNPSQETVTFYNVEETLNEQTGQKQISFQLRNDIVIQRKVHAFALSPKSTFAIYTHNTNKSTEQNSVRLYKLSNVKRPAATKHFSHDVDSVEMRWNKIGTALLVYTATNTDQSDKSYYGENKLYYVRSNGNLSKDIQLEEEGPVHDLQWSPRGNEFVAVYGYSGPNMRATLFDAQSQPIFEFLQQPENTTNWKVNKIFYAPHGRFLVLAGFGGFTGTLLFFDRERKRLMGINQAAEPTFAHWSPDSRLFIVGTHYPKLRVANKFQIYKYNGQLMYQLTLPQDDFLYHAIFRPVLASRHKNRPPSPRVLNQGVVNGTSSASANKNSSQQFHSQSPNTTAKVSAYVPPHLRGKTADVAHGPPPGSNFNPSSSLNASKPSSGGAPVKTVVANIFAGKSEANQPQGKNSPPPPNYEMAEKKKKKRIRKRKKKKGVNEGEAGSNAQGGDNDEEDVDEEEADE
ncbi:hypothetical protein C9374_004399 [Naegleria lovaniensis]|uniref:Eukaryotic translation initiation factor 2A n=1 Tax=Naegleria lovaniensis TaxID=51637 RepID=A0AA88GRL5_NAELO|nr:uncharacterized protein C9374_004399 [Naegleria lovaniensis]KAG2383062.1 hypothetical protein C9374_004399 [Naegleria lovaniensis]